MLKLLKNIKNQLKRFKRKVSFFLHFKWRLLVVPVCILFGIIFLSLAIIWVKKLPAKAPSFNKSSSSIYTYEAKNKNFQSGIGLKDQAPIVSFSVSKDQNITFLYQADGESNPQLTSEGKNLTFTEVEKGIDLKYQTLPTGIKEEIVLNQARQKEKEANVFTFDTNFQGAFPKETLKGIASPIFYDENGKYLFHFEKPFAIDAAGNRTDSVSLQIEDKSSSKIAAVKKNLGDNTPYLIRLTIDEAWLNDPARTYPIIIDPTIVHDTTAEFAAGQFDRAKDTGSGAAPILETYYQELTADINTVGLWHMNEASGDVNDSSRSNNTLTNTGTSIVSGIVGNGRSFSGTNKLSCSDANCGAELDVIGKTWTIEAWINTSAGAITQSIVSKATTGQLAYQFVMVNGIVYANATNTAASWDAQRVGSTNVADGKWHHVAMVFVGSTNLDIYVDGRLDNSSTLTGTIPATIRDSTQDFYISTYDGTNQPFSGVIDEVQISNVARTAEEIKAAASRRPYSVYTSPAISLTAVASWNPFTWTELGVATGDGETLKSSTGLIAQWNFNETSGTTADNAQGNSALDGTLTNFASTASQDQLPPNATGGTISYSGGYTIHTFTGSGTFTVPTNMNVEVLAVAGGGGGANTGSGGGGGGVVYNTNYAMTTGSYSITVGGGGPGGATTAAPGTKGGNSVVTNSLTTITAEGGGAGTSHGGCYGGNGGSGGGGPISTTCTATGGTASQGYAGGAGYLQGSWVGGSGGGGGAGGVGTAGGNTAGMGNGGVGISNSISGAAVFYAGGGGGGEVSGSYVGTGGNGGGGTAVLNAAGGNGTANTGGGGAGGSYTGTYFNGGNGGSGIVIIRYPTKPSGWTGNNKRWGAGALTFDGVDDYISIPNTSATSPSLTTLETWYKASSLTDTQNIIDKRNATDINYLLQLQTTGKIRFYSSKASSGQFDLYSNTSIETGKWAHVVATYDGITAKIYINGELDSSVNFSGTLSTVSDSTLLICRHSSLVQFFCDGILDSTRIYSRALTADEIMSNYQAGSIELQTRIGSTANPDDGSWEAWKPITSESLIDSADKFNHNLVSNLVSYWPMDESSGSTAKDNVGTNNGTVVGTTIQESLIGRNRYFNGSSYINVPDDSSLDITGNFTISAWVNKKSTGNRTIVSKTGAGGSGGFALITGNAGEVYCRTDNGSTYVDSYTNYTGWVTATSGWVHVAASLNGTSCRIYINGVDRTNVDNVHAAPAANSLPLAIGVRGDLTTEYWFGYLDEVRIYDRALSEKEIQTIYNYQSLFPELSVDDTIKVEGASSLKITSGETKINNSTVGLWHLEETGGTGAYLKDSSGNANHATPTGLTIENGASGKAKIFNGASSFITIPANTAFDFAGDYTLEAWVKPTTVGLLQGIIGKNSANGWGLNLNSTNKFNFGSHSCSNFDGITTVSPNKWYYVVGIYQSTGSKLYVNGVLDANGTLTGGNCGADTSGVVIGQYRDTTANNFFGTIDEVRISNVARTAEEIAETYRMGRDRYINKTITSTDLSSKISLPFYVAGDRPGSYLTAIIGESPYANYQPDSNTVGLWHLDETQQIPTYFDYDSFEGGPGSTDDWTYRNSEDPDITSSTAFTGKSSLHMSSGWGRNFESGSGEPTGVPYDTNTYPYMCMAYKIPATTKNNMLILLDGAWRSITMTQGEAPTSYAKAASWNPLIADNTWQHTCINLDAQLDANIGTGAHTIAAVIWHDGGGLGAVTGEFWIDDFIISSQPYYPQQYFAKDETNNSNTISNPQGAITATGGTITNVNGYTIHTFTGNGTFQVTSGSGNVEVLAVGGGAGGSNTGGGGGAGGYVHNPNYPVTTSSYSVTIGGGGGGGSTPGAAGAKGGNTVITNTLTTITAEGGGVGSTHGGTGGGAGGSGGGGAVKPAAPASTAGVGSQGYNGGVGYVDAGWVGNNSGGGGAGGAGAAGTTVSGSGGGGLGIHNSISGTTTFYAGGGGGGPVNGAQTPGAGGSGIGGAGGYNSVGGAGAANTGSGGGGGSYSAGAYSNGGAGGSGIVIIRYPSSTTTHQNNIIGTSSSQGRIGKARSFNGTSDFVLIPDSANLDITSAITIDAWIKTNSAAGLQTIVGKRDASAAEYNYGFRTNGDELELYYLGSGTTQIAGTTSTNLLANQWYHVAVTFDSSNVYFYVNGILQNSRCTTGTCNVAMTADDNPVGIGRPGDLNSQYFNGSIDEVRISNVARTANEIRQAYEIGLRSHPITIDFGAKLDAGNLISSGADLSFTIDATYYGLQEKGDSIYQGDKIIIKENYDGTEYIAQGNVSSVNSGTGDITVSAWDAGSTFPSVGYTANATVFKWQKEYWNINNDALDSHIDAVSNLSLRLTDGSEGRTIYFDDLTSTSGYLSDPTGSVVDSSTGSRYFQYRAILSSFDEAVSPTLSAVSLDYVANAPPTTPTLDSPADAAANQSMTPALLTTATDINSDYLRYKIELCTDLAMTTSCQTFNQTISQVGWSGQNTQTNTAYTSGTQATYTLQTNLLPNTTYYWRSYAIDPDGSLAWSSTQVTPRSFTTSANPDAPTIPYAEGATNPTGVADLTPEFSAIHNDSNGDNAIYYEIEVNTAADFSGTAMWDSGKLSMTSVANGARSQNISYAGTGLSFNGSVFYWRIRFWDTFDLVGAWSDTQNFSLNNIPDLPILNLPINAATNIFFKPALLTTATDINSDYLRYKIELCTDLAMTTSCQTFNQTISQVGWSGQNTQTNTAYTSGTQATYTLQTNLLPNTTYYWRSYAIDPAGSNTWSATQSTPFSFVTMATPLPASSCFVQESITDDQLLIVWTDNATNENFYEVQRSVDGGAWTTFQTGLAANTNNLLDTTISNGHTYQYRIAPYFTGPYYSPWCTASTLNLGVGLFNLEGIKTSGLNFN